MTDIMAVDHKCGDLMRRSWRYLRDIVVSRVWNPLAIEREPAAGPFTAALRDLRFRA